MSGPVRGLVGLLAAVLTAVALSACGDGSGGTPDGALGSPTAAPTGVPTTTEGPPAPTEPAVELIEFEITDGRAEPPLQRITVEQGATVRIVVTGDAPDEIHLHGYDLEAELVPGDPAVIEFVADRDGQFELETHGNHDTGALVLLQLLVR